MEKKLNAIVVKAVNYGENDKILTLFSLEEGLISARIKGVKKAGAKLKFASEPFCFAEFILSSSGDKNTVIGASMYEGFYSIRESVESFYAGACVLEFLSKFALIKEPNAELFDTAINTLKELVFTNENKYFSLLIFFVKSLKNTGYALTLSGCQHCGEEIKTRAFFDANTGAFLCPDCVLENAIEVSVKTYALIKKALNEEYEFALDEDLFTDFYLKRALKFIAFYIVDKTEEKIKALSDLLTL